MHNSNEMEGLYCEQVGSKNEQNLIRTMLRNNELLYECGAFQVISDVLRCAVKDMLTGE